MDDFRSLNVDEQLDLLAKSGSILISYIQGSTTRTYYSLHDFFVKVTKGVEVTSAVELLRSLDDIHLHEIDPQ